MKNSLLFFFLFYSYLGYSQEKQPIEQQVARSICDCVSEYESQVASQQIKAYLDTCSVLVVKKYAFELDAHFAEERKKNNSYSSGYEAGKRFLDQKVAPLLFKECQLVKKSLTDSAN